ncbi:hypothetical protein CLOM_g15229 [Closterium sp. NIES-68]|nr:hypothetical protein CLOM_g15229 [Closterium sp. NIES-68]
MESVPLETAGIVAGGPPPDPTGKAETVVPLLPVSSAPSNAGDPSTPTSAIVTMATSEGPPVYNTLNEPVMVTLKRDVWRVIHNLRNVVLPIGRGEGAHSSIRDWDLWGPFFFIIFLAFILSSSASENKSKVFAVVFGVLSSGAVILTLNVLLLGGRIIFFQSLSVLGYCLFPLDVGALVCLFIYSKWIRFAVVIVTLLWSSSAAYPFVSGAVPEARKFLAVYPVFLLYISVAFLVLAND